MELLPWQAAVMVMAVTLAGLLHEHPEQVRPLVARLQAAPLRAASEGGMRPADLLDVVVRFGR